MIKTTTDITGLIKKAMEEKIITLASFPNITEASIVSERLENEGIESYVVDSNADLTNAVPGPNYGGVKINIREGDLAKAALIIKTDVQLDEQSMNE